ncbi:MAG: amino acid adenylation domain-containing protein [Chloroflexota bacterium]
MIVAEKVADLTLEEKRALVAQLLRQKAHQARSSFPLSHGQEALWFLYNLAPDSWAYNNLFAVRILSELDVPTLKRSFQFLMERHPALRTTFTTQDDQPIQRVQERAEVYVEQIDATGWDEAELKERLTEQVHRPFDLYHGPVMRLYLYERGEREFVLLLLVHHICFDFWSFVVLIDELSQVYPAVLKGHQPILPPPPGHFADFVRWEQRMLAGGEGEEHWEFWKQQLAGAATELNLATDRPRPPAQTYDGASLNIEFSPELTARLKEFVKAEGGTLFMTVLAAYQILMHRYSSQEDVLVGSPAAAGRGRKEFADSVGYFINPIVYRANFSGDPTVREFLAQVRQTVISTLKHQDYPFPLLVERLNLPRDPSRSPVFQVWFALQRMHRMEELSGFLFPSDEVARMNLGGLELESFSLGQQEGQFDLSLEMIEIGDSILGIFKYNTALFDQSTIQRMALNLSTLLEGMVAQPDERVSRLPILTPAERHQLLYEWNDVRSIYPGLTPVPDTCIHDLIEAQVARTPNDTAVIFEGQQLTYKELDGRANQLAHYLQSLGVGTETLVGISVERSLDMVVGLLGIQKAGGTYVPLDPGFPQDRLDYMVEDSGLSVILTQESLVASGRWQVAGGGEPIQNPKSKIQNVLRLDTDWPLISRQPTTKPQSDVNGWNLAYVIYTSGSTGKPKGVQVLHRAVANFLKSMAIQPGMTSQDVLVAVTTLSFDIAGLELYLPLMLGAKVVVASREVAADGARLLELLKSSGATIMQATPATWRMLLEAGWGGRPADSRSNGQSSATTGPRLKILCGGEALPRELANQLLDRATELWNVYGPTETTIWSAVFKVEDKESPIVLGRPIANNEFYILDKHLQPVPVGVPGELYIGGDGLARGYRNRPELTAERFILNPFVEDRGAEEQGGGGDSSPALPHSPAPFRPGPRIYKTGDLARFHLNGDAEYLGRTDFQVKIRGFRIELGEIESVLESHPQVRQAVVAAVSDGGGSGPAVLQRLVAYVIPKDSVPAVPSVPSVIAPPSAIISDLRAYLKEKLPDYMVPNAFVFMDSFPLTLNNKVDRRALPKPDTTRPDDDKAFVAPRDALEFQVVKIWERVLGIQPISVTDNFFELGAHSLLAVRLFAELGEAMGRTLPLTLLFQSPTVEGLAELLRKEGWSPSWSSLVPIQPNGSKPPFFCVHGLGGHVLLFRDLARRLGPDQPFYGLQAVGLDGQEMPHTELKAMAAHYVKEMRSVQPHGPYYIGSLCYGMIGYEMAQQLRAEGEEVAVLVLFDSFLPVTYYQRPFNQLLKRISYRLQHHPSTLALYFWDRIVKRQGRRLQRVVYKVAGLPEPKIDLTDAHLNAIHHYNAAHYPGRVALIWSDEYNYAHLPTYQVKWSELIEGEVEAYTVPGPCTHQGMLREPHVEHLAAAVRSALDTAQAAGSRPG